MKSLASTLFAALFVLAAAKAFAADPSLDIGSPWWDSNYVQVNPAADDDKPAPAPEDKDKDKS